jgi:SAM-dependent methyltransferase
MSAIELLGERLQRIRYVGLEISDAISVAQQRLHDAGVKPLLIQGDMLDPPLADGAVDVILAEGSLHHTRSTEEALKTLARRLRPGGRFMFYVYRSKGPVREFTDDYIRDRVAPLSPDAAWAALVPLTRLGIALGELQIEVDVPEPVDILGIPAGPIDVQRLFYWYVVKAFHHPGGSFEEALHINYDWFTPRYSWRQTPGEVQRWCGEAELTIEREVVEDAGITVIARKEAP